MNSPQKSQWRRALMSSLSCVWINGWVNNREAGDLRRYRAHYDVIVCEEATLSQQGSVLPVCLSSCYRCLCMGHGKLTRKACWYLEGNLPKGPYLPCVSMAGKVLLAEYHRSVCSFHFSLYYLHNNLMLFYLLASQKIIDTETGQTVWFPLFVWWIEIFALIFSKHVKSCYGWMGSFMSYFNEYHHWTFPKHNHMWFVSLNGLIPGIEFQ